MKRNTFLMLASVVAVGVGSFATLLPAVLLESKGTVPNSATNVWMTEVGILLIAIGIIAFLVRNQPASPTLQALFLGNAIIQIGLFSIEIIAYFNGVITKLSGIMPNSIIHILLTFGFLFYLAEMRKERKSPI